MKRDKENMHDHNWWNSGRWSLNICGYAVTARILWMEGHLSLEEPRQWAAAIKLLRHVSLLQWALMIYNASHDESSTERGQIVRHPYTSSIYIARSRQSVNEITCRNRLSWICYYRRIHEELYGSITFGGIFKNYIKTWLWIISKSRSMTVVTRAITAP